MTAISVSLSWIVLASTTDTLTSLANFGLQLTVVATASVLPERSSVNQLPATLPSAQLDSLCIWLREPVAQLVFQERPIVLILQLDTLISLVSAGLTAKMNATNALAMLTTLSLAHERSALKTSQLALLRNNLLLSPEDAVQHTSVSAIRTCALTKSQCVLIMNTWSRFPELTHAVHNMTASATLTSARSQHA